MDKSILLGTTTLHNGMILSTLSMNSHDFALGFPKGPHTSGDVFLTYKSMIILLISQCGTQQSSRRTKYTTKPSLRPMEASNSLPLIEARLLFLKPSNEVHPLFDT